MHADNPPEVDSKLIDAAIVIATNGLKACWNAAWGSPTHAQKAYYERASSPQVGDLVIEHSSFGMRARRGDRPEICLGTLVERKSEWLPWEFETEEEKEGLAPDELGYREDAWYIKLWVSPDDAPPVRWTNADFVSIPRSLDEARQWEQR